MVVDQIKLTLIWTGDKAGLDGLYCPSEKVVGVSIKQGFILVFSSFRFFL